MNINHCLITLEPLKKTKQPGYSSPGIKYLTDSKTVHMQLPFSRREFILDLPQRQKGLSLSGYQPKLSVTIKNGQFNVVKNFGTFILKPSPEAYPHLAENEHAIMSVMKRLGFNVPPFGLVHFKPKQSNQTPELAFIIKRFDRPTNASQIQSSQTNKRQKHHQEQLDGAMAVKDKYGNINGVQAVSYEQAGQFLFNTVDHSLAFKKDFFLRIVYAYLLGNNDLHLRNLAILIPEIAKNSLAPVYDYISTAPYAAVFNTCYLALPLLAKEENDGELAFGFDSAYGQYIGFDFIELAKGFDLNEKLVAKWLIQVVTKSDLIIDTLRASHMQPEHRQAVEDCFIHRIGLLQVQ